MNDDKKSGTAVLDKNTTHDTNTSQGEVDSQFSAIAGHTDNHGLSKKGDEHERLIHELSDKAGERIRKLALTIKANPKLRKEIEELAHDLEGSVPRLAGRARTEEALIGQVEAAVNKAERYIEDVARAEEKKELDDEKKHKEHNAHPHEPEKPKSAEKTTEEKAKEKLEELRSEIRGETVSENVKKSTPVSTFTTALENNKKIQALKAEETALLAGAASTTMRGVQATPTPNSTSKSKTDKGINKSKFQAIERLKKLRQQVLRPRKSKAEMNIPFPGGPAEKNMPNYPSKFKEKLKRKVTTRIFPPISISSRPIFKKIQIGSMARKLSAGYGLGAANDTSINEDSASEVDSRDRGESISGNTRSDQWQPSASDSQDDGDQNKQPGKGRLARQAYNNARARSGIGSHPRAGGGNGAGKGGGRAAAQGGKLAAQVGRVAAQAAVRGGLFLFSTPVGWAIIAIILLILLLIIIIAGDSAEQQRLRETQCQAPTETMTVAVTGPPTAAAGATLTYEVKIADTVPNQEVTVVATIPEGVSTAAPDVTSSWTRFTLTGNTITWKATENLPPNSLSPPNITFTVTLKATAPSVNAVLVIDATPGRAGGAAGGGTTIVLDPGHGGTESVVNDPASGLIDRESANTPEREEVFEVAQKVKTDLEAAGYTVVLTKQSVQETTSHRARSDVANNANAALAVSIHNDHAQPYSWSEIYTQKVGLYREANGARVEFTDAAIAQKSLDFANIMAQERAVAEGRPVPLRDANFDARPGYSSGNIPLVMLFARVPWVYNEIGAAPVGQRAPQDQIDKYAVGITAGIKKAVPVTAGAPASGGAGCVPGGAQPGGGAPAVGYVPPSAETCGGKYTLSSSLRMNFGDPQCNFNKDALYTQLQQEDPANADVWFNKVIPCESGFNPNAFADPIAVGTPDSAGAWGLYQMGSASPPGTAPPAPGKNGVNDRGDVPWNVQTTNATTYGKRISRLGAYWSCAR